MSGRWAAWLRLAVLRFGLPPGAFWSLTLAEWRALCAAFADDAPPGRAELQALCARYPDQTGADERSRP